LFVIVNFGEVSLYLLLQIFVALLTLFFLPLPLEFKLRLLFFFFSDSLFDPSLLIDAPFIRWIKLQCLLDHLQSIVIFAFFQVLVFRL